ncbi:sn-glycerol-3-phosphate transport system permease protein UgpA [Pandoraea iniqua]|uniref:sn-glycerol-3-phosphate transport system permease protein UgpA n=1 Tax=Pandoraea iniqua TaxID=2508288 RepID=A0A5E4U8Q6_9BURK|nr:sugar ABC transporter permease [Pandoraea iniqua]VVD91821.1 sn-glycerol-3-phosphate transport system permease protein UgpA [Pandoraea iniqua]VVD96013.1 sn-glycerol-3-phosphate transport system permease protein UgpA [Pandoraea iniqua]
MNRSSSSWVPWLLLLPALVLLVAFTHYPAVATLWHSFFSTARAGAPSVYVGAENYQLLLDDPVFWQALRNNVLFALITVPVAIAISIAMALWVHRQVPGRALLRLAYFTPAILPMIAVANIWLFFYTPQYGLIAQISQAFGGSDYNWLGQPGTALPALMIVTIWKEAGFFMIFYLAALQQISPTLAEAAALEGASRWQFFRRVQWPLLMPTTLFVVINAVINAFRLVDHVVVMTRGGPDNATQLLLYYIYQVAFSFWDTSYAAALTVVLLTLLAVVAFVKFRLLDSRTHYQ